MPEIPLLTLPVHESLLAARAAVRASARCSLDLGLTETEVSIERGGWRWGERLFPYLDACRDHTVYYWAGEAFAPAARYSSALIKLVPTSWGPPTFEIDGIKMLPSARVSPLIDAQRKVALLHVRGKRILDCCAGLGYFARACLDDGATLVQSFEINPDVLWLRSLNPWSPDSPWSRVRSPLLALTNADVTRAIQALPAESFDAALHDPPRFAIAGELYSLAFYQQLSRVLRRQGMLFHYTGSPNRLSRGRDLSGEVIARLRQAGFDPRAHGDGIVAVKRR